MNEPQATTSISANDMMLNGSTFERAMNLAEMMSKAAVTVPQHLRGKQGDCLAIVMQAATWGMNPFVVAQKTHLVNGTLGYEAQLVNAVIQQSGAIHGRVHYEYQGDAGNVSCRVGAIIKGEAEITWGEWLNERSVTTKNSPLWKTNPKQQLGYLQVKNWARQYAPGAILGVYDTDEIEPPMVKDMGSAHVVSESARRAEKTAYTNEQIQQNASKWSDLMQSGKKTPDDIITMIESKFTLSDAQKNAIHALNAIDVAPVEVTETVNEHADFLADMEGAQ